MFRSQEFQEIPPVPLLFLSLPQNQTIHFVQLHLTSSKCWSVTRQWTWIVMSIWLEARSLRFWGAIICIWICHRTSWTVAFAWLQYKQVMLTEWWWHSKFKTLLNHSQMVSQNHWHKVLLRKEKSGFFAPRMLVRCVKVISFPASPNITCKK